jgi:hypothetical protein
MTLPRFDSGKQVDIFTGTFPKDFPAGQAGPMQHSGGQPPPQQGGGHQIPKETLEQIPEQHRGQIPGLSPTSEEVDDRSFERRLTTATGYVALALLALTLLIGPANLLLRRRTPVSNYLSRDVGTWAAIGSVVHTIFALQVHGTGRIRDFLNFFVAPDGSPLLNSFGLGNWTGLAALVTPRRSSRACTPRSRQAVTDRDVTEAWVASFAASSAEGKRRGTPSWKKLS